MSPEAPQKPLKVLTTFATSPDKDSGTTQGMLPSPEAPQKPFEVLTMFATSPDKDSGGACQHAGRQCRLALKPLRAKKCPGLGLYSNWLLTSAGHRSLAKRLCSGQGKREGPHTLSPAHSLCSAPLVGASP